MDAGRSSTDAEKKGSSEISRDDSDDDESDDNADVFKASTKIERKAVDHTVSNEHSEHS